MDPATSVGASTETPQTQLPQPNPYAELMPRERPSALGADELWFLAEAGRALSAMHDVEATLAAVLRLAIPHLGVWCFVDVCEGDHMRRVTVAQGDGERKRLADGLAMSWPPTRDSQNGLPSVLRTRQTEMVVPVTDEVLRRSAGSAEELAMLRALRIGGVLTVPLFARGEALGAITYVCTVGDEPIAERDRLIAEHLAERVALALDKARLLEQARIGRVHAEEANQNKMRFLSTMSHELRTPLNAIAGYAELLETGVRGPLNASQIADVRRIRVNQRHLLSLVESVLNYARADAGLLEFSLEPVPIDEVLSHTEMVVAPLAEQRAIRSIGWHGAEAESAGPLCVRADREKLQQILVNLVANAVKFSHPGGRIDVFCQVADARVEIRIRDQGVGIPPEEQERIFEPFVQLDSGLTRKHGGTGLGLAISRELALGMGGELSVESTPGRGSTFTLTLPLA
jgi:signal transduction histidine kinase